MYARSKSYAIAIMMTLSLAAFGQATTGTQPRVSPGTPGAVTQIPAAPPSVSPSAPPLVGAAPLTGTTPPAAANTLPPPNMSAQTKICVCPAPVNAGQGSSNQAATAPVPATTSPSAPPLIGSAPTATVPFGFNQATPAPANSATCMC